MTDSDAELIARYQQAGDSRAFTQLVRRHQSQVRVWARRLCDGDSHTADDLAQEAFIKAHAALTAYRGDAKFSVWLYRILFNVAASRWRRKKLEWCSLDDRPEQEGGSELNQFAASSDVSSAVARLSEPQQIAIRLCFEEGFSHDEAARVMGVPLGTLKTHINRAKARLKELLASWEGSVTGDSSHE